MIAVYIGRFGSAALLFFLLSSVVIAWAAPAKVWQFGRFNRSNAYFQICGKNVTLSKVEIQNLADLLEYLNGNQKELEVRRIGLALLANHNVSAAIYTELARSYYSSVGEFSSDETAQKYLHEALKLEPKFSQAYSCLSEIANSTGDHKSALAYADKAISCTPVYPDAYLQKSFALLGLKRPHEALGALDLAEKYQPGRAEIFRTRGSLLESMGKYEQAVANFKRAYAIDGKDWTAFQIAHCLEAKGSIDQAIAVAGQIIERNNKDAEAYRMRAGFYEKVKKYSEAIKDLTLTIELEPTSRVYLQRAHVYELLGRKELAAGDKKAAQGIIARPLD